MNCPMCGRQAMFSYQTKKMHCPACGWGTGGAVSAPGRSAKREAPGVSVSSLVAMWLIAAIIIALAAWIVFGLVEVDATRNNTLIFAGCTLAYALIGYYVRPDVDTDNLGWAGGLINNPFRISDNFERGKLKFLLAFYPGRLIGVAIVNTFRLIRHAASGSRDRPPS